MILYRAVVCSQMEDLFVAEPQRNNGINKALPEIIRLDGKGVGWSKVLAEPGGQHCTPPLHSCWSVYDGFVGFSCPSEERGNRCRN